MKLCLAIKNEFIEYLYHISKNEVPRLFMLSVFSIGTASRIQVIISNQIKKELKGDKKGSRRGKCIVAGYYTNIARELLNPE